MADRGGFAGGGALLPGGYFVTGYRYSLGRVDAQAHLIAQTISNLINSNPTMWRFETLRIEALLAQEPLPGQGDAQRIFDLDGNLVTGIGNRPSWPTLTISREMLYAGRPVGRIEITHSLVHLLQHTGLFALFGGLLADGTYPLVRGIRFATTARSAAGTSRLLEFFYSPKGRAIAKQTGVLAD